MGPVEQGAGDSTVTSFHEDERMSSQTSDRTGILIVRVWIEGQRGDGFRARITQLLDSGGAEPAMATAGAPEGVYGIVPTWVELFLAQEAEERPVTLA